MDKSNHVSIDMEQLETSLKGNLKTLHPLSEKCCIYRVLPRERGLNKRLYTPQIISIGPIHYGREELKAMEEYKRRYLNDFLQRTQVRMIDLLIFIKHRETRLRNCYAETIELESDEFVEMIMVDAVFIIELLLRTGISCYEDNIRIVDRILTKPWMIIDIISDMFLLENQLPMFILKDLYFQLSETAFCSHLYKGHSFVELISGLWSWTNICKFLLIKEELVQKHFHRAEHFVDLLRLCLQPSVLHATDLKTLTTPSVTELHQAGVQFKLSSSNHLLDIRFNDGILEIPNLKIVSETKVVLRNIQIFERLHCKTNYVNDYITIMNYLVNTPKDVDLLIENGVIENWMGNSEAVSSIFHKFIKEGRIFPWEFYYSGLVEDLNAYCKSPWHKWKANLKQNYFNSPWACISVTAAAILLFFTFIQTVCSIIQTVHSTRK
ncbi:hypothetical protein ACOSQ4_017389 [Xanthoceras sorbifolium]